MKTSKIKSKKSRSNQGKLWQENYQHRFQAGGELRKKRAGRKARPLSNKNPIHVVFKINNGVLKGGLRSPLHFRLCHLLFKKYLRRFHVRAEQISIQNDHIHGLLRVSKRFLFQNFLRVFAGQLAQKLSMVTHTLNARRTKTENLWKYRPFTRVVVGYKAYRIVKDYIQLNEMEALGAIPYQKQRLKGLSSLEWLLKVALIN